MSISKYLISSINSKWYVFPLFLFIVKLSDVLTTMVGLYLHPGLEEKNPVAVFIFSQVGIQTGSLILLFGGVAFVTVCIELPLRKFEDIPPVYRAATRLCGYIPVTFATLVIVFSNILWLTA